MLIAAVFAVALATVPLAGGSLSALGRVILRRRGLLLAAVALQVVALTVAADGPESLPRAGHLASYGLLGAFVWANRHVPGLLLAGSGGALNLAAIAANGGVMPASPTALREAGMAATVAGFSNSEALADPRLWWLGDVFAVPAGLPLATVFSVGDVVLVLGAAYGVHAMSGSPAAWRGERVGSRRASGAGGEGLEPPFAGPKPAVLPARRPPKESLSIRAAAGPSGR